MRKYLASLGGERHEITVEAAGEGRLRVSFGGKTFEVDPRGAPEALSLLIDSRPVEARVSEERGRFTVEIDGATLELELEDARRASTRKDKAQSSGKTAVRAPMPGRVARILVAEGDQVKEKQGLVVIEAMKMENELKSPRAGTVSRIIPQSRVGSTVEGGEELAIIE
jgi:biotin carboxyl carrier protein